MRSIRLVNVNKSYDSEPIFTNFNLTISAGTFFVLLGPSGCGKTTVLRLIDGFETVDSGKIYLDDEDITHVPINKRNINTVFQNYALFPHLNVFENVAYGLKIKKLNKDIIEKKVLKVLKTVNLEKHINKQIQHLSGGQKQRVALARAIVNEPNVLLFDEPLAALDLKLREKMLLELVELQNSLKTTFVYVTHDQSEALAIADQIAVMNQHGQIEQIGTPKEIYEFPQSSFVAKFIGTTNLFEGKLTFKENMLFVEINGLGNFQASVNDSHNWTNNENKVFMNLRPEKIFITKKEMSHFDNKLNGKVSSIIYYGKASLFNVMLNNKDMIQVFEQNNELFPEEIIKIGDSVNLYWQKDSVTLLKK